MATAAKKTNPFEKLGTKAPVKSKAGAATAGKGEADESDDEDETDEEEVVSAAKARLAKRRAAAKSAEPEVEEVEDADEIVTEAGAEEETPKTAEDVADEVNVTEQRAKQAGAAAESAEEDKPKRTRRTAAQVEAEAAEREAALQAQLDELRKAIAGKADAADIEVLQDRVVLEEGQGGDLRVVGNGKTLANNDWRATIDGLRLILGRASSQATSTIQLPVSLVPSLAELLSNIDEITE